MKKKIAVALCLIILMLSTNVVITFAATKSEIQSKSNEINMKISHTYHVVDLANKLAKMLELDKEKTF